MALISCNFPSFHFPPKLPTIPRITSLSPPRTQIPKLPLKPCNPTPPFSPLSTRIAFQIYHNSLNSQNQKDPIPDTGFPAEENRAGEGNGSNSRDWTTSILLFALWAALLYYVFVLTPNQTPILIAAGLGIIGYAGLANGDVWMEFYQYFRESKFVSNSGRKCIVLYNSRTVATNENTHQLVLDVKPINFSGRLICCSVVRLAYGE